MPAHANLPDPMDDYGWIEETTRLAGGEDLPAWRTSSNDPIYEQTTDDAAHQSTNQTPPTAPGDPARTAHGLTMKWTDTTGTGTATVEATDTATREATNAATDTATDAATDTATDVAADVAADEVERWIREAAAAGDLLPWPARVAVDEDGDVISVTVPSWLALARAEEYADYDAAIPFHVVDAYTRHMTNSETLDATGDTTGDTDGLDP